MLRFKLSGDLSGGGIGGIEKWAPVGNPLTKPPFFIGVFTGLAD